MINLINREVKSANVTVPTSFVPLRCGAVNAPNRTFVEVHLPQGSSSDIEWAFSDTVTFGERIRKGDTHTFRVGPNVNVLVRALTATVTILVHEGA